MIERTAIMPKISTRDWQAIRTAVNAHRAFVTYGALAGSPNYPVGPFTSGRLPEDWVRMFTARRGVIDYVITSYATPIAWHDEQAGWVVPDTRYSVTTSKHQGTVRMALSGALAGHSEHGPGYTSA
jgi:hypothetical protein